MNLRQEPIIHPLRASAAEFGPAPSLESVARDRLLALVVGLAFIHAVVAFGHLMNPAGWDLNSPLTMLQDVPWGSIPAFVLASATAVFLLVVRLLLPRLPLRWSHPMGTLTATLVVLNALGWFTLGVTPEKTVPLAFAIFAAGSLIFTTSSLALIIGIALTGWLWFAWLAGFSTGWYYFGGALLAACCIALLFQRLHLQAIKQMVRTTAPSPTTTISTKVILNQPAEPEDRFRRWYEATFEGIAIHERGIIIEANQALATLLRCNPESLRGQNLLDWFTRASRDMIEESILLGNFRPFEAVARRPDKTELHVELFTKWINHGGKNVVVTAFRDITERQRAASALNAEQERLRLQYRRQTALARLATHSGESTEVAKVLDLIAETATTVLPVSGGTCILIREKGGFALASSYIPRGPELGFEAVSQLARVTDWITDNREAFVASNITHDDPFEVNSPTPFVSAYVGVPLLDGDHLLGILFVLEAGEPRQFKQDEMDFINELASRAAIAIAKSRLYEQLSEANRHLEMQKALLIVQNEELAVAKTQAEAASAAKSDFLAKVSHELRTPMNGVIGMTDYLLTTELNADQRESAEALRESGERLLVQIDHILDFSRLETGQFKTTLTEFDIRQVLAKTAHHAEELRADKPIEVRVQIAPNVPERLRGDFNALHQVLSILVDNATRYTERGEIVLGLVSEPISESKTQLRCSVRDTGRGMSAAVQSSLFDPFAQADNSLARTHEGLGLGLATAHRLVTKLRGRISVESSPGQGSTFTIIVPMSNVALSPAH